MDDLVERLRAAARNPYDMTDEQGRADLISKAADALEAAREDTARLDWLSQHDVGICHLGYGDYQWYTYANPVPEHGMLGLRATIDAARKEARNG